MRNQKHKYYISTTEPVHIENPYGKKAGIVRVD